MKARAIDVPAMDGKRIRVGQGDRVVLVMVETPALVVEAAAVEPWRLHAAVMLTPENARELARIVKRSAKAATEPA